jgi:hypothetical protein
MTFPARVRNTVLTAHIMVSVGLLGDSAGFLAVALRMSAADDPATIGELARVLDMFASVFGIPLSIAAIVTGVTLGLGSKWGVFRYPWVIAKLLLIVSVMLVGGFAIGPALTTTLQTGANTGPQLVVAALYDVVALSIATALSVFKPGRALDRPRQPAFAKK